MPTFTTSFCRSSRRRLRTSRLAIRSTMLVIKGHRCLSNNTTYDRLSFIIEQLSIDLFAPYSQRIMGYIQSGKSEGATCHIGGERHGTEGYFIQPTIFTDCKPDMKIVREEIFGPVGVIIKFNDDEDVIKQANDTTYGLASAIFSQNLNRAIKTANKLHAGTVWVRPYHQAFILCAHF